MFPVNFKNKFFIASGLILFAIVGRLVPHLWNMTPVAAVAILAGSKLGLRWGMAVAFFGIFLSDLFLGFYTPMVLLSVYTCLILSGMAGYFIKKSGKILPIVSTSIFSTSFFFLVTNFAVWRWSGMYLGNLSGLWASYIAGLPFFANQIIGDLFFTVALFTVWELAVVYLKKTKLVVLADRT